MHKDKWEYFSNSISMCIRIQDRVLPVVYYPFLQLLLFQGTAQLVRTTRPF